MTETHDAVTSSEHSTTEAAPPEQSEALLSFEEARVLGCLLEKERTTPAEYPMTANAVMRACNQSTSRHPVVAFDERTVESALAAMKGRGLVRFVHSQSNRSTKFRQVADERWALGADEAAVVCLLLLRGAQTPGELRTRAERLHPFDTPEAVERTLGALAAREPAMVIELTRSPGQKERRWVQVLTGTPTEAELAVAAAGAPRSPARHAPDGALVQQLQEHAGRIESLEAEVRRLRTVLEELAGPIDPELDRP